MSNAGPLSDVNVVEMTAHRAGPFCGALLADLGADVVKIERPGTGDPARDQGPGPDGRSGYFMANNRNKRSVTLDLKSEAGVEAARSLLAEADVFVENFGYGVTDRLGIGYEAAREINEGIVYASVKGYGETGPYREKPGLDLILQAEGGIMSVTGPEGGPPVKVGQAIGDLTAGTFAALGVIARLYERERTGEGGKLDVGLFDAIVCLMNEYLTWHSIDGRVPEPRGTVHQTLVPYQLFETADGHLVTGVASDDRWDEFVDAVGCEGVRGYRTNAERVEHADEVIGAIAREFAAEPTDYWIEVLTEAGFPNGPLNDVAGVMAHDQTDARRLVRDVEGYLLPGHPVHFPDHDTSIRRPAPELGEHTEEVFGELTEQATLSAWREGGAFGG